MSDAQRPAITAKEAIALIQSEIGLVAAQGSSAVDIKVLNNYLSGLLRQVEDGRPPSEAITLHNLSAQLQIALADHHRRADLDKEQFKTVITTGHEAIKAKILINGGALVAMLALVGHAFSLGNGPKIIHALSEPLKFWIWGLFLGAFSMGQTYVTQYSYAKGWLRRGHSSNLFAITQALVSFALFLLGCLRAVTEFRTL